MDFQEYVLLIGIAFQRNGIALSACRKVKNTFQLIYLWEDRLVNKRVLFEKLTDFLNESAENAFNQNTLSGNKYLQANIFIENKLLAFGLADLKISNHNVQLFTEVYPPLAPPESALVLMLSSLNDNKIECLKNIDSRLIQQEINDAEFGENILFKPVVTGLMLSLGEAIFRQETNQEAYSLSQMAKTNKLWNNSEMPFTKL